MSFKPRLLNHFSQFALVLLSVVLTACPTPRRAGGEDDDVVDVEGDEPGECADGTDNDANGDIDCGDGGCAGSPDCAGDDDDQCTDHVDCADAEICLNLSCEPIFNRPFVLALYGADVEPYDILGDPWDAQDLPDPYLRIEHGDGPLLYTETLWNTLGPEWEASIELVVEDAELCVVLFDDDAPELIDAYMDTVCWADATLVDLARGGSASGEMWDGFAFLYAGLIANF